MIPDSAIPVQQNATIIEIRPYRGGWQCFEGSGIAPFWTGNTAKEDATAYARARAKFGRGEIRVIDRNGNVEHTISFSEADRKM